MKSLLTLLLVCCLGFLGAQNQTIAVSGRVFYGTPSTPARNISVNVYTESGIRTFLTDSLGRYATSFALYVPPAGYAKVAIEVRDFCTGQTQSKVLQIFADSIAKFENINFTICQSANPPPPTPTCKAFFIQKADPANPKTIYFQDLSAGSSPITKWSWNFGDGATSTQQNPVHTYNTAGTYIASLTIVAPQNDTVCSASYRSSISVQDTANCNCSKEYIPVCVKTENGTIATFPNKCFALCAGYTEAQFFTCRDTTCVCPAVYAPVCVKGPDGGILEFGNACEAACKGYKESDFVECRRDTCDCPTDEYAPVCVVVNGDTLTYGNPCRAKCAGFKQTDFIKCPINEGCNCTLEYAPVCVVDANGDTLTFSNKCFAYCKGFEAQDFILCNSNPGCICPAIYDPVCVKLPDGSIKKYGNACEAKCVGFTERDFVRCDSTGCNCPKILDPICALAPNGDTITYTNKCFAVCAGISPEKLFQCRPNPCLCPPIFDPVCVKLADGNIIKYNSKCDAICNGFKESDIVLCDSNSCVCPEYYDPVCVVVNGDTLTFDNPCFAKCKGFTENQWFRCRRDGNCSCPLNLDPVCVKVDGAIKEFPNACVAKCYGFKESDFVRCVRDTNTCNCPLYYDPVCAVNPNGDTITFSNKCFAACAGYNNIFRCNSPDPNNRCAAAFDPILRDSATLTYYFKDLAKVLQGSILGWKWDFGDGQYGDSQNPTHTFARPGVYTVTQYIATSTGCTSQSSQIIKVGGGIVPGPSCQAMFTFVQKPDRLKTIEFKNLSFGNISSVLWEFGDGYTSTEKNPTHTYSSNGLFFVKLTIRSTNCQNTTSMVIVIDPNAIYDTNCNALFLPILFTDSLQVLFKNLSSTDAKEFKWSFGDGTTSTEFAPSHTYRQKGIYEVTLTITTADGCTNTFRSTLNLGTQNFTGNPEYKAASTTGTKETQALRNVKLYPNPVKDELTVEFNAPSAGNYLLQIFSLEGKLLQSTRESANGGSNLNNLNISYLPAGMYLLRIQTDGQTKSIKFVKQ